VLSETKELEKDEGGNSFCSNTKTSLPSFHARKKHALRKRSGRGAKRISWTILPRNDGKGSRTKPLAVAEKQGLISTDWEEGQEDISFALGTFGSRRDKKARRSEHFGQ